MCIRDRCSLSTGRIFTLHSFASGIIICPAVTKVSLLAVSYTHLDVYKRQCNASSFASFRFRSAIPVNTPRTAIATRITKITTYCKKLTFVEKEAKRILTNINGDDVAVYAEETDDDGNKGIGLDIKMVDENGRFKACLLYTSRCV